MKIFLRLLSLLSFALYSCVEQNAPHVHRDLLPAEEKTLFAHLNAEKASIRLFYAEPGGNSGAEEVPVTAESAASLLSSLKSKFPVSRVSAFPDMCEVYFSDSDSVANEIRSISSGSLLRLSYFTCSFCKFHVYVWLPSDAPLTCYEMLLKSDAMLAVIKRFFPKHYPEIKKASSRWVCDICAGRK